MGIHLHPRRFFSFVFALFLGIAHSHSLCVYLVTHAVNVQRAMRDWAKFDFLELKP